MVILNGRASGEDRVYYENQVSSAKVWLNGQQIAFPSDFNQNVYLIEKSVGEGLAPSQNLLEAKLQSSQGSFITVKIIDQDQTPPSLNVTFPGSYPWWVNTPEVTVSGSVNDPSARYEDTGRWGFCVSGVKGDGAEREE